MPTEKEIIDYSYFINGYVTESFSNIETLINSIISNYYCKDKNKVDDLTAIVQELNINKRIEILFYDVIRKISPEIIESKWLFKYLKLNSKYGYSEGILTTKFKDGINSLKELRNLFSHNVTQKPYKEFLEFSEFFFILEKFYPKEDLMGFRSVGAKKSVLLFKEGDFLPLSNDVEILKEQLSLVYNKVKSL